MRLTKTYIGGSCAGLMCGILLKRQGHNVRILEQATSSEREGTAAGIGMAAKVMEYFDQHDRLRHVPMSVEASSLTFLDAKTLDVTRVVPYKARMTSWDACYYRLRANFDGLKSAYCAEPPDLSEDVGIGVFELGKRATGVSEAGGGLVVSVHDLASGGSRVYEADIVIAADGGASRLRRQLQPSATREYPGYVLWRGTITTASLSRDCIERIEGKTIAYRLRYSYVIIYTIPGEGGSLKEDQRAVNFAWYTWENKQRTRDILTDTDGHTHHTTLPKGKMRPEIWDAQVRLAKQIMHPLITELAEKIEWPFITRISSIGSKQAKFFHDRLFFIGDALVQNQPNSGQGVSLTANDAMTVAQVIGGQMTPAEWETRILELRERERLSSRAFGSVFLCTWWGVLVAHFWYRSYFVRQSIWAWCRPSAAWRLATRSKQE